MADPWAVQSVEAADPWAVADVKPVGRKAAPARSSQQPTKGVFGDVFGGAMNLYRSIPLVDEGAAALDSGLRLATGKAHSLPEAWKQSRELQDVNADDFQKRRPIATAAIKGTGNSAGLFVPGGGAANLFAQGSRVANMARGATIAAGTAYGYAAADKGSLAERAQAGNDAASNPLTLALGAAGGALAPARKAPKPLAKPGPAATLAASGVQLTPGQKIGGIAKSAEDLAQRAPILGTAIRGARQRGAESLNRVVALKALEPIGQDLPKNIQTGHQAVEHVSTELGKVYDRAADMVPQVAADPEFTAGLANIEKHIGELPTDVGAQYRNILKNRVQDRLAGKVLTGRELRAIQSEVGDIAAKRSASDDGGQQALGHMLEDVSDELKGLLGRFNPEAGKLIQQANKGWSRYIVLRSAASKAAKGGVFTPGQLSTAVRTTDRSAGKGNVAKGKATLQDLSGAASEVMPDAFGNPGTADAVGLGALATGIVTAPAQAVPAAAGLTAAATPYFLMGRKVLEALPAKATATQLQAADRELATLAAKDPAVRALRRQVAARAAVAAGAAGAQASTSRNLFAQP